MKQHSSNYFRTQKSFQIFFRTLFLNELTDIFQYSFSRCTFKKHFAWGTEGAHWCIFYSHICRHPNGRKLGRRLYENYSQCQYDYLTSIGMFVFSFLDSISTEPYINFLLIVFLLIFGSIDEIFQKTWTQIGLLLPLCDLATLVEIILWADEKSLFEIPECSKVQEQRPFKLLLGVVSKRVCN